MSLSVNYLLGGEIDMANKNAKNKTNNNNKRIIQIRR